MTSSGANRSLGFTILQALASHFPFATYILACRSPEAGFQAVEELRKLGVTSAIEVLELDVTDDKSTFTAVETVKQSHGKLDVLIKNAGIAQIPSSLEEIRTTYNATFNTNITSMAVLTTTFLPLLQASSLPYGAKVINVSSARGSLTRSTTENLPPTQAVAYSISKAALNALTVEFQKTEDARVAALGVQSWVAKDRRTRFFAVSPGHLKTAFNGYRGEKSPLESAEVVVRLVCFDFDGEGKFRGGSFWEVEGEL